MSFVGFEAMTPEQHAIISRGLQPVRMMSGAGFAAMAWRLARIRAGGSHHDSTAGYRAPLSRSVVAMGFAQTSAEYYRIIDAAEHGFEVMRSERACGMRMSNTWYL